MNPALTPALLEEVRVAYAQISGLPLCIHITDVAGRFLFANEDARKLFGLGDGPFQHQISDYYEDPKERSYILRELRKVPAGEWHKGFRALLHIQGDRVKVKFSSKPFFDENGNLFAMLNITNSMSRVEWYADLEDELEVGLFVIDRHLKIADCNQFLAEMLGFESASEMKGKSVGEFMWEPDAANDLLKTLLETPKLRKQQMKLKRKDGTMVLIEMSCDASSLEDGEILRVRGVVKDTTFKAFYDDLPVGLFLVNNSPTTGEDILSQVNLTFAKIHGYEKVSDVLGIPSNTFKSNIVDYDKYRADLAKAAKVNRPLLDYYMEILDKNGRKRNVVVNVKFIPDHDGQIRVGAVYDLTDHVGKHLRTLESDFSALLHTYIATLNGLQDTLNNVIKAQGPDVIRDDKHFDSEKTALRISGSLKRLGTLVSELNKMGEERKTGTAQIAKLQRFWSRMTGENSNIQGEKDNAAWQRRNLIEMRKALDELKNASLPREVLKNTRFEMDEMLRLTSVTSLSISMDELNGRIPEFYYFRDYLRRTVAELQDFVPQNLMPILLDSISFLEGVASKRGIAIVKHFNQRENLLVNCNKTSISRAFQSLLENAIKYSWHKTGDNRPWVDVRVDKKQDGVEIVFENWGVAIRKEELENDLIFQFGQRGREADDHGRSGTGIGLYDARNIIEKHGGTLRLSSEAILGNPPELYSKPFITKAFIYLPTVKLTS